eukprot:1179772-Prorocentrum_minimum.AAC.1
MYILTLDGSGRFHMNTDSGSTMGSDAQINGAGLDYDSLLSGKPEEPSPRYFLLVSRVHSYETEPNERLSVCLHPCIIQPELSLFPDRPGVLRDHRHSGRGKRGGCQREASLPLHGGHRGPREDALPVRQLRLRRAGLGAPLHVGPARGPVAVARRLEDWCARAVRSVNGIQLRAARSARLLAHQSGVSPVGAAQGCGRKQGGVERVSLAGWTFSKAKNAEERRANKVLWRGVYTTDKNSSLPDCAITLDTIVNTQPDYVSVERYSSRHSTFLLRLEASNTTTLT